MPTLVDDMDALLNRAREHDNDALGALLESQTECVRRLVSARLDKRLKARIDVEDVVQDVWAEAIRRFPEYITDAALPFSAWLQHVALDCLSHCHRTHIHTKKRSICAEGERRRNVGRVPVPADQLHGTPDICCTECELVPQIKGLIERLALPDQVLLQLRIVERVPVKDVSVLLGITEVAVRHRQLRILDFLREHVTAGASTNDDREAGGLHHVNGGDRR